jgi:mannitol-1-/sugar-/sorbitol-6-phosphatase
MLGYIAQLSCQVILFDLDGVLVDSDAAVEETWRMWAARHGLDATAIIHVAQGRRALDTVRLVAPHLDAEHEVAELTAYEAHATTGLVAAPGARVLLEQLPPAAWAVVTSGVRAVAEHRLRFVGLPMPPVMVCAEDVARGKPDPEGYLAAAARCGTPPGDCVVIDDAPAGLDAARDAGMRAIAVASKHPLDTRNEAAVVVNNLASVAVHVAATGVAKQRLLVEASGWRLDGPRPGLGQ